MEEFLTKNRLPLGIFFAGLLVLALGIFTLKGNFASSDKVEVLEETTEGGANDFLVVEVAGAVTSPGVYKLPAASRVDDALIAAGGLSLSADRNWVDKTVNRAALITDGQKIYIPTSDEQLMGTSANNLGVYQTDTSGQGSGLININTSSQSELESLNGIGPVYARKIIEQRPYSNIEELASRKVIPQSTYEKIKNDISVFQ